MQTKWEENDEKPTTVALGLAGFVGLWAASGLLDSINRLPFVGTLFEAPLPPPSQTHTQNYAWDSLGSVRHFAYANTAA